MTEIPSIEEQDFPSGSIDWSSEGPTLIGMACGACSARAFPYRDTCLNCGDAAHIERVALTGRGRLYAMTVIHHAAPGFQAPYAVGYVDLDDGVRVFTHLAGEPADHHLDAPVTIVAATLPVGERGTMAATFQFAVAA